MLMKPFKLEVESSYVDVELLEDYLLFYKLYGDNNVKKYTPNGKTRFAPSWLVEMQPL
jgi:hypothetical protein